MSDKNQPNAGPDAGLVDEVDLEQVAKAGGKPPKAKRYRIRIDDQYYVVSQGSMTGAELLKLASKTPPENYILTQKLRGGVIKTIGLSDVVDFTTPGIERFNTLPRQVQEG
ncbi:multiubiquitin domain-containing protein [Horticoccus luteus]|uniref:Multiubiquitin domain-containing protein n=1 Tax=Horticoccus luteus TaxID=2862869 RepID=A0A8F9TVP5_9BACT|nr:multiubiquitin domain-containing protein [Horticoccus luteus]QYM78846.1 multiubiquitin domain-containing protein [Horticoccus luteus]